MRTREKILDDIANLAGGTLNIIGNVKQNAQNDIRARVDEMALRFDLVPRSDFERVENLLKETRIAQNNLEKRLDALENSTKKKAKA